MTMHINIMIIIIMIMTMIISTLLLILMIKQVEHNVTIGGSNKTDGAEDPLDDNRTREWTNGISTNGVTALFKHVFFDRDFLLTPVNLLLLSQKCQGVTSSPWGPQSVELPYFCSGPISVDRLILILCYTILYHTMLCYTLLYYTILYCTILYHLSTKGRAGRTAEAPGRSYYIRLSYYIILYSLILHNIALYNIALHNVALCYIILHYIILYCIILHYVILKLYNIALYYIILYHITVHYIQSIDSVQYVLHYIIS